MYPVLLDTVTGKTATAARMDKSLFWWSEGNGSCDCNRAMVFEEEVDEEMEAEFGEGVCYGCHRFLAIDVHGDLEGHTKQQVLDEMNRDYPADLISKHHTP